MTLNHINVFHQLKDHFVFFILKAFLLFRKWFYTPEGIHPLIAIICLGFLIVFILCSGENFMFKVKGESEVSK